MGDFHPGSAVEIKSGFALGNSTIYSSLRRKSDRRKVQNLGGHHRPRSFNFRTII
jgi:hypothetical protein